MIDSSKQQRPVEMATMIQAAVEKTKKPTAAAGAKAASHKIVKIDWVDAEVTNDWKTLPDMLEEGAGAPCVSVGFMLKGAKRKDKTYFLANTITVPPDDEEMLVNGVVKIPKKWVTKVEVLVDGT